MENPYYFKEKFTYAQAWIDLLMLATHQDTSFRIRGIEIKLTRGQIGLSQLSLSKRWRWSRGKVRKFIFDLETRQQIRQQTNTETTIITILNYDNYQNNEQQKRQQTEQQVVHNQITINNNKQNNSGLFDKSDNLLITKQKEINIAFEEFRNLYNKKIARPVCEKKRNKLMDKDREMIIKTLPNFLSNISDKKYQPHPQTYLNQRRREDDYIEGPDYETPKDFHEAMMSDNQPLIKERFVKKYGDIRKQPYSEAKERRRKSPLYLTF